MFVQSKIKFFSFFKFSISFFDLIGEVLLTKTSKNSLLFGKSISYFIKSITFFTLSFPAIILVLKLLLLNNRDKNPPKYTIYYFKM